MAQNGLFVLFLALFNCPLNYIDGVISLWVRVSFNKFKETYSIRKILES